MPESTANQFVKLRDIVMNIEEFCELMAANGWVISVGEPGIVEAKYGDWTARCKKPATSDAISELIGVVSSADKRGEIPWEDDDDREGTLECFMPY